MITPKTIALFLIGHRRSIEAIAASRSALLLGLLFIISAGLARNYDHHILTEEPMWILAPIGMTLFSSLFIFAFIKVFGRLKSSPQKGQNYLAFLSCFVMTAPLAWLYGIPVENHTSALTATQFNFTVLLIVSFWRLALMIKVISVLFIYPRLRAIALIALPASIEMFIASIYKSVSIVGIMGGMNLSTSEQFLRDASDAVTTGSFFLFIIALALFVPGRGGKPTAWKKPKTPDSPSQTSWIFALLVIAAWLFASIKPQQRLRNLQTFREFVGNENYEAASNFSNEMGEKAFPPHRRFLGSQTYFHCPTSMSLLAHHDAWPNWLRRHFTHDISHWLNSEWRRSIPKTERYRILYKDLQDAQFTQKVADEITPGVNVADYSREYPSNDLAPTISDPKNQHHSD